MPTGVTVAQDRHIFVNFPCWGTRCRSPSPRSKIVNPLQGRKAASDGLESDAKGRVYATAYEQNGIVHRKPDSIYGTIVHDPCAL